MDAAAPHEFSAARLWAGFLIVGAVVLAYANSHSVPFLFDDRLSIVENETLRHLWPPWSALMPPGGDGRTVEGRPLLNFSLALNHAVSGPAVGSYHVTNLAIHALAALALFGLVRRTLSALNAQPTTAVALATALLWAVHPLQTESVTYIVQRAESLMGLLFLLTLYAFLRGAIADGGGRGWFALSIATCALGMATKEVMVSAPVLVLLYDRTFLAGSFRDAWRLRRGLHAALFATWLVLAALVVNAGNRGGTIGAEAGVAWWQYALCQSRAVIHYLQLALWPKPLIFDYGSDFVTWSEAAPFALLDVVLLALTALALWRRPALGFIGAWYFVILAPTSSVVGGTRQMLAEHRTYLSLAAVTVGLAWLAHQFLGRRAHFALGALVAASLLLTLQRNADYRSSLALWHDTATKRPDNPHAHYNLANEQSAAGHRDAAIAEYRATLALLPAYVPAHFNLANALVAAGQPATAIDHYESALRLKPTYAKAHFNLANVLRERGRPDDALTHYHAAVQSNPAYVEARDNLGGLLLDLGRLTEAETQFREVLRLNPSLAATHCNLGTVHLLQNQLGEAQAHYEKALALDPKLIPAREGLARVQAATAERASPNRR